MEFADLNEEIGADGWLIPRQEITRRRLVRQTKQYKIYRADWFGDVLVYEPNGSRQVSLDELDMEKPRQLARYAHKQQDFSSRLSELCLKLNSSATSGPMSPLYSTDDDDGGYDSAYSSISSTPTQFNARHTKRHEFQFPSSSGDSLTSVELQHQQRQEDILISACPALRLPAEEQHDDNSESSSRKSRKSAGLSSPPVILNKSSFFHVDVEEEEEQSDAMDNATHIRARKVATTTSSWFELNELRLVAHENFLLFMGASLEHDDQLNDDTSERSLVMQMSHPKSMSLFNLLHANKCDLLASNGGGGDSGTCSPIDRFFANGRQQQQQRRQRQNQKLSINAKLNICQQVTNAMTYLHDKNIVHGRLTSVNIYLELNQRVKISLLDNDELPIGVACNSTTEHSISLNLPTLTYLSPELVKTISLSLDDKTNMRRNIRMDLQRLTKESDIYSFGTLLYELFHEKFPYAQDEQMCPATAAAAADTPTLKGAQLFEQLCLAAQSPTRTRPMIRSPRQQTPAPTPLSPFTTTMRKNWNGNIKCSASELIFHIGSGQTKAKNLQESRKTCPALVDQIISTCWSSKPHERPTFKQLRFE